MLWVRWEPNATKAVNHVNFFEDPGTVDFLVRALRGQTHPATPIVIEQDLPSGKRRNAVRTDGRPTIAATPAREQPAPAMPIVQAVPAVHVLPAGCPWFRVPSRTMCFRLR